MSLAMRTDSGHLPKKEVYIMISGIKRSGSTWQANAVKTLYERWGYSVWMGEEYEGEVQAEVTINKVHPYIEKLADAADVILTSYRPIQEIRESWRRFRGQPPGPDKLENWIRWIVQWNLRADHMMHFETLYTRVDKVSELQQLSVILPKIQPDPDAVHDAYEKLESLSPPDEEYYDENTLMFHNHITSDEFKT